MSVAAPPGAHKPRPITMVEARKVDPAAGWHRQAAGLDFSYAVLPSRDPAPASSKERRSGSRQRTRLRSGKIIAPNGEFIIECLIHNRSASGCHLRLPKIVTPPDKVFLYEDQSGELFQAHIVWRRERDFGMRLSACPATPAHRALAGRMRRKFYALGR